MQNFIEYIEEAFQGQADSDTLYRYKRQLLGKMTERANEVTHTGLRDDKVLNDLIISEFPDLQDDYQRFRKADRKKRREKLFNRIMIFGSIGVSLLLVIIFLAIGFVTDIWTPTWLIVADGILLWVIFILSEWIRRITGLRRLFHPIARVMLAIAVMCATVASFLFALSALHLPKAWVIFPFGVICIYLADAIYANVTKQKLRIINYLVYILAASPMVYVFLGGLEIIPWAPGWLIVPLAVVVDIFIILGVMANNAKYKYKPEVDAAWNED